MKKIYSLIISLLAFFQLQAQWSQVFETTETNFYTLYALDKERVFLGSELAAVHRSQDGGSSFSISDLQEYGFIYSIAFEDQNIGYAGGGCYFPFEACPGNTFYSTADGGTTWDTLLSDMEIGVFTEIVAMGGGDIFAISDYGGMYFSPNGGLSWQPLLVENTNYPVFGHMQFLDAHRGFVSTRTVLSATNAVERLHYTTNGGANWSTIYEAESFPDNILDFHFTDAQNGIIALPGGRLLRTNNGGTDWSEQIFGATDEQPTDLFFVNANTAYMSSFIQAENHSRIYRSNDGGNNWAVDMEMDSTYIGKLYFVDKENGWALSDYRKLIRRTGIDAVQEDEEQAAWLVYPNPAGDYFTLRNSLITNGQTLHITNAQGQLLKVLPLNFADNSFSIAEYSAGLYLLRVVDEGGKLVWNGKLVKEE